ncbi:ATP-grasp domain-containing protein [Candidatus Woesearchaeota archaeon]|nr:ATP-grasp domain-containing protein [Candidatus Woesearchaeota archaeon]
MRPASFQKGTEIHPLDPAIAPEMKLDPEKHYMLSFGTNNKVVDLAHDLAPMVQEETGKPVEVINVLTYPHAMPTVIVNSALKEKVLDGMPLGMYHISPEEMNRQATQSGYMQDLVERLRKRQGSVLTTMYKNTPELDLEGIVPLAPDKHLVHYFDDKVNQRLSVVADLGLPIPRTLRANSLEHLLDLYDAEFKGDAFVMCPYSSFGSGTQVVKKRSDISDSPKLKGAKQYLLSDLLDVEQSPSTLGIIAADGIYVAGLTDQLLDGTEYKGNLSPTTVKQKQEIKEMTIAIGEYLHDKGYRGPFGVDYMIADDKVYFTEINPRIIGATPEIAAAHAKYHPELPGVAQMIYTATVHDTLGFNPNGVEASPLVWASRLVAAPPGTTLTRELPRRLGDVVVKDRVPAGSHFYNSDNDLCRIVMYGNGSAQEVMRQLDQKEKILTSYLK